MLINNVMIVSNHAHHRMYLSLKVKYSRSVVKYNFTQHYKVQYIWSCIGFKKTSDK